jgi:hypothetical protein
MDWQTVRDLFPATQTYTYLNSAAAPRFLFMPPEKESGITKKCCNMAMSSMTPG